ncbi:Isopenicillin N synthase [Variovorax sp. YR266]|uniref:isopenicillin N synthase family dioxygenase n=1 Tax=Variovorax sp. YR266 TaxID=1884386 RepID=UPI00089AECF1|nr:2OG-Fe(II) oxygenase family protein [Variovorax sp. YR266]SDY33641.1 Isopenicillin N synthase [Variovorax sp. YR266]
MKVKDMTQIPVIDLQAAFSGAPGALDAAADELQFACENIGFLYIKGHGVDEGIVDSTFAAAKVFHDQPLEQKLKILVNENMQGYMPIHGSTTRSSKLAGASKPNENEAFFLQREIPPTHPKFGSPQRTANVWPDGLPGFKEAVLTYYKAMDGLIARLLPLYARALDMPVDFFANAFQESMSTLRLTHYPKMEYAEGSFGVAPHTDSSFITLLAQNKIAGLQLMSQGGEWINAPAIDGTFVVNTGDMLNRWSNGRFLSTPHRAYNLSNTERYAIPYFCHPDPDFAMKCIPSCTSEQNPPKFPTQTSLEYIEWHKSRNYHHVNKELKEVA